MPDSESDESIKPRCWDDESGHLGQSGSDNESKKQLCDTTHAQFVKHSKTSVTCITGGNIELATSSRSAHNQGNQGCHITPEEAESFKGGQFIETPNLTSPNPIRSFKSEIHHRPSPVNVVGQWEGDVVGHEWKRRKSLQPSM